MLPYPHTCCIVYGVRYSARHGPDACFTEAFCPKEPTGLEAINEYLGLFGHIHYCGDPIGQVADAVVACAGKFAIPRDGVRRHLKTLDE